MICNNCKRKLPDDSEFCQYCGCKIEKIVAESAEVAVEEAEKTKKPVEVPATPVVEEETGVDDMTPEEALAVIMEMQAKNTIEAMEANGKTQPNNEGDADFGLVPEKPIFTLALMSVDGEREYLNRLYTTAGEKIQYTRRGSTCVEGINGMIDVYDTFLPSGQPYKTIYINMYGATKSAKAPVGFVLNAPTPAGKPVVKKEKPVKMKYCSRCGSVVDSKTKICTGCGKKYFKGIRFNKFSITVIVLSLMFIGSAIVNIYQYDEIDRLTWREEYLEGQVSDLSDANQENQGEAFFFDYYAEIVGDDGTELYHKYGCKKLDTDDGFWIFNTEAAESQGYNECPYCH